MRFYGLDPASRRVAPRDLLGPFLFGAVAYLVLAMFIGLALAVPWLTGRQPAFGMRLAHVHFALLGGATQAMLGSIPFFGVALLATAPPGKRLVRIVWWLANAGTLVLGFGFIAGLSSAELLGGLLVLASAAVGGWTLVAMLRRSLVGARLDVVYYCAAFFFGLLAMVLGLLLVTGWGGTVLPQRGLRLAHLHLALIGWVSLTIVGTMHSFFPTILGMRVADNRSLVSIFLLLSGGVLALAIGPLWLIPLAYLGGLAIALAACIFTYRVLRLRLQRPASGGLAGRHLFAATLYFLVVVLGGVAMLAWTGQERAIDNRWLVAYGHLGLVGWIVQTLMGAMIHLLPVLAGGRAAASPQAAYVDWRAKVEDSAAWQFWLLNGGLLLFAAALLASGLFSFWSWPAFIGGMAMWASVVVFAGKVTALFVALRRTQRS